MISRWKRRGNRLATARLSVRHQLPWYARLALGLLALLVVVGALSLAYRRGDMHGSDDALSRLSSQTAWQKARQADSELSDTHQRLAAVEAQLRVETATRDTLSRQVQQLQTDNDHLREQNAFFEALMTRADHAAALTIESLHVEAVSVGHYRLRVLLLQGQASAGPFKGEADFRFVLEQRGHRTELSWPHTHLPVTVARFARLAWEVELPPDSRLRHVEMHIYGAGASQARLSRGEDVKG